jgi:hypothetical protein
MKTAATATVAEICRRLDGVPLAIELVAARTRVLPPEVLLERLTVQLDLGGDYADMPERQRTLRSTVDWSYRLLGADERSLLTWLSVFVGGWTVQAAEAVGAGTEPGPSHPDALDTLSSLVDKSLVMVDDSGSAGPRFRMLGAVAEYAAERLDERGEREAAEDRLVEVVGRLAEEAADGMRTAHRPWAAPHGRRVGQCPGRVAAHDRPRPGRDGCPLTKRVWERAGVPLRDRQSVRVRRLRQREGIITVAATRCSPMRAVMVAVFAPERRGGINEIAVSDTAVHTNRSAGRRSTEEERRQ